MKLQIQDQVINGYELGTAVGNSTSPILISQLLMLAFPSGIFYKDGELTLNNVPSTITEAYIDGGILKIR